MVAEGRRILRNIQRVTKLFVTKSVFAAFLIVAIGITPVDYPLLPRHLTLVGALTVGIPAFFLALAPSEGPWRTGRLPARRGPVRGAGRGRRRARGDDDVPDRGQRLRPRPAAVADCRHVDAGRDRPLPRARARGDEHAAGAARRHPLCVPAGRLRGRSRSFPARGASSSWPCRNSALAPPDHPSAPASRSASSG